ncbi:MAG: HEAT repeat domain-containing protein [Deltaproteobacteria bacterium]|nr:HEAT repeat domain-containing protein [Deltaproteobacteria bacterium]
MRLAPDLRHASVATGASALLALTLSACDGDVSLAPQPPAARIQAARAATPGGSDWKGPWSVQVQAARPQDPAVAALAAGLDVLPQAWDGRRPAVPPGVVAVVWIETGVDPERIVAALTPARGGPSGEVVAVLAPGDPEWAETAAGALPWSGVAVVDPAASVSLYADPARVATDPVLAGSMAAWRIADHYDLPWRPPTLSLPPGLHEALFPPDAGALTDPDPRTRAEAVRSTGSDVGAAEPQVAVRIAAAAACADPAVLARLATDPEPLVRARVADRLDDPALLSSLLWDPSSVVRVVATDRLARLAKDRAGPDPAVVQALHAAATSPDAYQRWKAAWGLGAAPGTVRVLGGLLTDPDVDVRRTAALALGATGDPAASEPLVRALGDANSFVRRSAAEALGLLADPRSEPALRRALEDPAALVRAAAGQALGRLGVQADVPRYEPPRPPSTRSEVRALLRARDPTTRKDAAKFLAGRPGAARWLFRLAEDGDSEVRKSAVEALGWTPGVADRLHRFLSDPDPDVRVTALDALRRAEAARPDAVIPLLEDPDAEIRLRAAEALAVLGPHDALRPLVADPDERIRAAAVAALPLEAAPGDPAVLVRRAAAAGAPAPFARDPDLLVRAALPGADPDLAAWGRGVLAREDDLLHVRFSWNDPAERKAAYRALRPPVIRAYGHPDRG